MPRRVLIFELPHVPLVIEDLCFNYRVHRLKLEFQERGYDVDLFGCGWLPVLQDLADLVTHGKQERRWRRWGWEAMRFFTARRHSTSSYHNEVALLFLEAILGRLPDHIVLYMEEESQLDVAEAVLSLLQSTCGKAMPDTVLALALPPGVPTLQIYPQTPAFPVVQPEAFVRQETRFSAAASHGKFPVIRGLSLESVGHRAESVNKHAGFSSYRLLRQNPFEGAHALVFDMPLSDLLHVRELLSVLENSNVPTACRLSPLVAEEKTASALAQAGCQTVALPVYSGSQRMLMRVYRQPFTTSQILRAIQTTHHAGMFTLVELHTPTKEEDWHTVAETERILRFHYQNAVRLFEVQSHPFLRWLYEACTVFPPGNVEAVGQDICLVRHGGEWRSLFKDWRRQGKRIRGAMDGEKRLRNALEGHNIVTDITLTEALLGQCLVSDATEALSSIKQLKTQVGFLDVYSIKAAMDKVFRRLYTHLDSTSPLWGRTWPSIAAN